MQWRLRPCENDASEARFADAAPTAMAARARTWRGSPKISQCDNTVAEGIMAGFHSIPALACAIVLLALPLALGGCVGVAVVGGLGAAAGGGYAAAQERGIPGAADDFAIKTAIEQGLMKAELQLRGNSIATTVYDGRVLLTGRVASPELKVAAEQIASKTNGVRALYDEIEVAPAQGVWDAASDDWITTSVRSQLVLDPGVRSVNYTIDTANGSVYLIGSARSQGELDRATQIARYVPGVRRVVSYVEIRAGSPVAAMPPPSTYSGPATGPGPAGPGAAPQAPVEVQKL
jgi:osmotically-inducible protein OsmY